MQLRHFLFLFQGRVLGGIHKNKKQYSCLHLVYFIVSLTFIMTCYKVIIALNMFLAYEICNLSLPPGVPVRGAACPGCTGSLWLSSCGREGPSNSHLGYQHRSGKCVWPHLGDPDSSGWCLCSSRLLLGSKETQTESLDCSCRFTRSIKAQW